MDEQSMIGMAASGRCPATNSKLLLHGFSPRAAGPSRFCSHQAPSSKAKWLAMSRRREWSRIHCAWRGPFGPLILPPHPEPVLFPRKMLDLKFAVLLMRSSYEAVDALNFIPMDKFQVKFWKLRRDEVEAYTLQYRNFKVRYGDLTDPLYFDFISFAQFATIGNEMRVGELVFQEKVGVDGELKTIQRDPLLRDNAILPAAFNKKVGDLIYALLLNGFEDERFDAPPVCTTSSSFAEVVEGVRKLVKVFVDKGYALKASVDEVQAEERSHGGKFRVRMEGTATQWGSQELASRNSSVFTHFEVLAIDAFLRASRRATTYTPEDSSSSSISSWIVT